MREYNIAMIALLLILVLLAIIIGWILVDNSKN